MNYTKRTDLEKIERYLLVNRARRADYITRCIDPFEYASFLSLWEEANEDPEAYTDLILESSNPEIKTSEGFAELVKALRKDDRWFFVRAMCENVIKTDSDAGGVLLTSDSGNKLLIPNGSGDGVARVAIIRKGTPFNRHLMNSTGFMIQGPWQICKHDCIENEVAATLEGAYWIYVYEGIVAFVEI